ncbi:hypothetical protein ACFPIJ_11585 [Dactylosporangium cerinum]|uniref:Knr4/Smi1-like domain-containing protein n=1 Tax=Dactylosporangium cerinum TaxID=1434730 RepID=A0ABV9VSN3_9ACTN
MILDDLAALRQWSVLQPTVRLVEGPPLVDEEIDRLPELIDEAHSSRLPVPFRPEDFTVPRGYRAFLRICSFLRIEYRDGGGWATYEPFNIFSPQEVAKGHSFIDGATLDDEEIYTSFLVAFATAGYATEASRWCFYTDADVERQDGELAILCESNDFECDLAKYVETGLWVPDPFNHPASLSFADWFHRLVRVVIQRPFDSERTDEIPNSFYQTSAGENG